MSTQKQKFELFRRLQDLGFTYEESAQLRRIEMTLKRWAEAECNGEICRHDDGIPYRQYPDAILRAKELQIADREAGALRRLKAIVDARNRRVIMHDAFKDGQPIPNPINPDFILPYHQTDPRGCMLYLVRRSDLPEWTDEQLVKHSGPSAIATPERRQATLLSMYYTRGLAVCA